MTSKNTSIGSDQKLSVGGDWMDETCWLDGAIYVPISLFLILNGRKLKERVYYQLYMIAKLGGK